MFWLLNICAIKEYTFWAHISVTDWFMIHILSFETFLALYLLCYGCKLRTYQDPHPRIEHQAWHATARRSCPAWNVCVSFQARSSKSNVQNCSFFKRKLCSRFSFQFCQYRSFRSTNWCLCHREGWLSSPFLRTYSTDFLDRAVV